VNTSKRDKVLSPCFRLLALIRSPHEDVPLTIRRCPEEVHQTLKSRAKANRRSLNNEALTWLDELAKTKEKPVTAREAARILREAYKLLTPREHREFGEDIEAYLEKVRHERLP
jgi:plasmid stability protein